MQKISAKVVAHSRSERGLEIATLVVTFPRIILAELNTHRMISKNSASSRAIPFKKMLKSVMADPFIPIAFQKDHSGMQGSEYLDIHKKYQWNEVREILRDNLKQVFYDSQSGKFDDIWNTTTDDVLNGDVLKYITESDGFTVKEWWLKARDYAVSCALLLNAIGVSKQLVNRLLEPFMWHTVLITSTEWENFFNLRCPKYIQFGKGYRSKRDMYNHSPYNKGLEHLSHTDWLECNAGQAEIHMMELAEQIYDALQESTPKELKAGEWHIPFGDNIDERQLMKLNFANSLGFLSEGGHDERVLKMLSVKIATARCARVSYTVVGEEGNQADYVRDIELHDRLYQSGHFSPFEHCARVMDEGEYHANFKGVLSLHDPESNDNYLGWSNNFKGFMQYRALLQS